MNALPSIERCSEVDLRGIAEQIKHRALAAGFDLVGICSAEPSCYTDHLRRWLDSGKAGSMSYLAQRFRERTAPAEYLAGAKSVVCVAMNYFVPLEAPDSGGPEARGRVARYALGDDYHEIIKPRLYELADWLRDAAPGTETRCGVDTAPIMEKELAARAGLGWMGKNTCVINSTRGSWLFLGEILTTLPLPPDRPATDHCGACTRCIDACPTQALSVPYQLDAQRCISYLTIERREEMPAEHERAIGAWIYGCDICQDVCPFNRRPAATLEPGLQPRWPSGALPLDDVSSWTEGDYRAALKGSAMRRVKLPVLKQSARLAKANLALPRAPASLGRGTA